MMYPIEKQIQDFDSTLSQKNRPSVIHDYYGDVLGSSIADCYDKELNQCIHDFCSKSTKIVPSTKVFWLDSEKYGSTSANAGYFDDHYYIGLSRGLLDSLIDEVIRIRKKYKFIDDFCVHDIGHHNILKIDTNKYSLKDILITNMIVCYILHHEVGHIILGHLKTPFIKFSQLGCYQAKEYCADIFGLESSFKAFSKQTQEQKVLSLIFTEALFIWHFIDLRNRIPYFLYNVRFENAPYTFKTSELPFGKYPHTFIRTHYMIDWIKTNASNGILDTDSKTTESINNLCDELYKKLYSNPLNTLKKAFSYEEKQINNIKRYSKIIQKEYENRTYL